MQPTFRLRITLAYDGTHYLGWQAQNKPLHPGPPTIQNTLEVIIAKMIGRHATIHGAGRTDAGVHALGQVCHVDLPIQSRRIAWAHALNRQLPPDIRILQAEETTPDFHSRTMALHKTYGYTLWCGEEGALPQAHRFCWSLPPLHQDYMHQAAAFLIGTHNFAFAQNAGSAVKTTVRTIFSINVVQGQLHGMACPPSWPVYTWQFNGNGFLKQMVRNLMGLLVWAGKKKISAALVPELLANGARKKMPSPCAPAHGLCLLHITYPQ